MTTLQGVILAGGMSRRMGRDKALLSYHGRTPQLEKVAQLLAPYCDGVEASCRPEQIEAWRHLVNVGFRADAYPALGPLAGILTALDAHPQKGALVVACDLPFLERETLDRLVTGRRTDHWATVFVREGGFVEPLCAIYEPRARDALHAYMKNTGRASPREALSLPGVMRIPLTNASSLTNVNEPDEYERALALIRDLRDESSRDQP